jgi:hypothetical protein
MPRTLSTEGKPTGNKAPLTKAAQEAGRKSAPPTGGLKQPNRGLPLRAWGRYANDIFRLRLRKAARHNAEIMEIVKAGMTEWDEVALRIAPLEMDRKVESESESEVENESDLDKPIALVRAMQRLSDARMYIDYMDNVYNDMYYTPIRSEMHIYMIQIEGKESRHPWAQFLIWYKENFDENTSYAKVYNEDQTFQHDEEHIIQFVYHPLPPVVRIFKKSELKATFEIYGGNMEQLFLLKNYVYSLQLISCS